MFNYDNKGIIQESEVKVDKHGFYYRVNTSDKAMINDCLRSYPTIEYEGKIVFDCGSNVGALARLAVDGGAELVVAYEPEASNFGMMQLNTEGLDNVILKQAAISGSDRERLSFWINKSNNAQCSASLVCKQKGRRVEVIVPNLNFWSELEIYKPSLIKMDIEGGEYTIFGHGVPIPDYVKEIVIEIHQPKRMDALYESIHAEFPNVVYKKVINMFNAPAMIITHLTR